jgi:glycosyltransferase involved in cell wall biosynthesis
LPEEARPGNALKALASMAEVTRPVLSIVVPLYNEAGNVAPLLERIGATVERLHDDFAFEIVLVNDGSTDGTLAEIRSEMQRRPHIVLVNLSRNFGHQLAATAGIEIARGDAIVLMDGDLQDPPELVDGFVRKWREGYDVVYAVRRTRPGESRFKVFTARAFYRIIKRLTKVAIPLDTGDFRLMSRRVVEALRRSPERHRFLRGMVSWVGFNQVAMIRFAIDGITSFSDIPLRFASYLGFTVSAVAFLYALLIIAFKIFSLKPPAYTPGWASTIVAVLFLGGVQLMSLGILGEYLGRVYDEVKGRPLYLISDIERS